MVRHVSTGPGPGDASTLERSGEAAPVPTSDPADLVGRSLLQFRITARLGAGGMGVVYKAFDDKLRRTVALKVLNARYLADERNKELIFREARSAAGLTHSNIATIHELHEVPEGAFFVMELVEGETLRQRIAGSGRIPIGEALRWAIQIARALARAHEAGIVHRDLKADNVMITASGDIKLLDFGLAKVVALDEPVIVGPEVGEQPAAHAATVVAGSTRIGQGRVVGTPAYMAPEQARGEEVDARADVFAFGVLLYEMVTGSTPFAHRTGIPSGDPTSGDWTPLERAGQLVPRLPRAVEQLVERCLAFERDARYADGVALVPALEACEPRTKRRYRYVIGAVLALGVVGAAVALRTHDRSELPPFAGAELQRITFDGQVSAPALSRDGTHLAYASGPMAADLVVQDLVHGTARTIDRIPGMTDMRWSPDGSHLLVTGDNGLDVISVESGARERYSGCAIATWSGDGREILQTCTPVEMNWTIRSLETGTSRTVARKLGDGWVLGVDWSSANGLVLTLTSGRSGFALWTVKSDGSDPREILRDDQPIRDARWSAAGDRIYYAHDHDGGSELRVLAFDPASGTTQPIGARSLGGASERYTVSADEQMLIVTASATRTDLVTIDGDRRTVLTHDTEARLGTTVSPDGGSIAFASGTGARARIRVIALDGKPLHALVPEGEQIGNLAWSPDGSQLAYTTKRATHGEIWRVTVATGAHEKLVENESGSELPTVTWAPGTQIIYSTIGNRSFVALDPITGAQRAILPEQKNGWIFSPVVSPIDGRMLVAWNRVDAGLWTLLPDGQASLIYTGVGNPVGWSSDGRLAYFTDSSSGLQTVLARDLSTHELKVALALTRPTELVQRAGDRWLVAEPTVTSDLWVASRTKHRLALAESVAPYIAPPVAIQPQPSNLGMEEGLLGGPPTGWTSSPARARVALVEHDAHAGARAVEITSPNYTALSQRIDATAYRGRRIRVQVWVTVDQLARLEVHSIVGERVIMQAFATAKGTVAWQRLEVLADIHPGAEGFELEVNVQSARPALIDDVSVEIVPALGSGP